MSTFQRFAFPLAIVAWIGTLAPAGFQARAIADTPNFPIVDTSLDPSGMLVGTLIDQNQVPFVGVPVALSQAGKYLTTATTDEQGRFSFAGLRGGTYSLSTGSGVQFVRVWTHGTAPPAAVNSLTMVTTADVVRAQGPIGGIGVVPLACLGMSATALALSIILPITLTNDDEEDAS